MLWSRKSCPVMQTVEKESSIETQAATWAQAVLFIYLFIYFSVCIQSVSSDPPFNFSILRRRSCSQSTWARWAWFSCLMPLLTKVREMFIHLHDATCLKTHTLRFSIEETGTEVSPCSCLGWIPRCCQHLIVCFVLFCFQRIKDNWSAPTRCVHSLCILKGWMSIKLKNNEVSKTLTWILFLIFRLHDQIS